jgi:hypothetical protein
MKARVSFDAPGPAHRRPMGVYPRTRLADLKNNFAGKISSISFFPIASPNEEGKMLNH